MDGFPTRGSPIRMHPPPKKPEQSDADYEASIARVAEEAVLVAMSGHELPAGYTLMIDEAALAQHEKDGCRLSFGKYQCPDGTGDFELMSGEVRDLSAKAPAGEGD